MIGAKRQGKKEGDRKRPIIKGNLKIGADLSAYGHVNATLRKTRLLQRELYDLE